MLGAKPFQPLHRPGYQASCLTRCYPGEWDLGCLEDTRDTSHFYYFEPLNLGVVCHLWKLSHNSLDSP